MDGMDSETPNAYRIEVTIPLALPQEMRDRLFTAIADAVHEWEPADREGWDSFVAGHAVYDDLTEDENARFDRGPVSVRVSVGEGKTA